MTKVPEDGWQWQHFADDDVEDEMKHGDLFRQTEILTAQIQKRMVDNLQQRIDKLSIPPVSTTKITVVRPFIYTFKSGGERRYDPGEHLISHEMAANPWVYQDFCDGRISHINGRPVHKPTTIPRTDHDAPVRAAFEDLAKGAQKFGEVQKPTDLKSPAVESPPVPGSLNLVGELNVVQHGTKVF